MPTLPGVTDFGTPKLAGGIRTIPGPVNKPGVIILCSTTAGGAIIERYLWISTTGVLRIHTAYPVDQDADGAAVGAQT